LLIDFHRSSYGLSSWTKFLDIERSSDDSPQFFEGWHVSRAQRLRESVPGSGRFARSAPPAPLAERLRPLTAEPVAVGVADVE